VDLKEQFQGIDHSRTRYRLNNCPFGLSVQRQRTAKLFEYIYTSPITSAFDVRWRIVQFTGNGHHR